MPTVFSFRVLRTFTLAIKRSFHVPSIHQNNIKTFGSERYIWTNTEKSSMKGAVVREFGGADNILIEGNLPIPQVNEKQVLIRVKAAGVNPIDTYIRGGSYAKLPELPYVVGREGSGVIEQVGPNVNNFKEGDRVWFSALKNGATAEFVAIDSDYVFRLPDRVSFEQGAGLGVCYFTAYRALFLKACAQAGQSILVHGSSGGVGLAVCNLAKVYGLRVFGTAGTTEGENLAKESGCEHVFNHREAGYIEQIQQQVPSGFNIIIEMLANVNLCADLKLIGMQGRIVVVGNRGVVSEFDPRQCMQKEASIIGLMASTTSIEDYQRMGERVIGLLEQGHITPYVGRTLPLEQAAYAHKLILEPGAQGKIIIQLEPSQSNTDETALPQQ